MRYSGLQLEVLGLYRAFLRVIRTKPLEAQPAMQAHVRARFEAGRSMPRTAFNRIERSIRDGRKHLRTLKRASVQSIASSQPSA
ncbi:SUMO-conjugating enzyme UBC9 [Thecamonas trahens ATCC 50062]|uniref:SUMO-conjugating enzyme UBC9 n=1 Tax=Thecamonas trahens ATCC 50062 TaxID=461836 RepID=A0A0L0DE19_THETB|nr:SUMO-conjugating enzyme UBC9 [Thecamonas trahens ATCC 50062]KNC50470.1 SUMO-conjugating enzyme UBC9 [Thecamonas trahens ATCC 50062]|eukprot:XP_013762366.1 SUMO-conjugating enzyme UBC9 [Thecamonas trahens ATCC 50062]